MLEGFERSDCAILNEVVSSHRLGFFPGAFLEKALEYDVEKAFIRVTNFVTAASMRLRILVITDSVLFHE